VMCSNVSVIMPEIVTSFDLTLSTISFVRVGSACKFLMSRGDLAKYLRMLMRVIR
jgi:hypothetical protein